MPTLLRIGPYRFFFYSHENVKSHEPPHVHVRSADGEASFELAPVKARESRGYNRAEMNQIGELVEAHRIEFLRRWYGFFDR